MKRKRAKKKSTISEAARKLHISRQAVYLAIKRGLLEAEKGEIVQTVWLISNESIDAYRVSDIHQSTGKKSDRRLIRIKQRKPKP